MKDELESLRQRIIACTRCPRLRRYCAEVALHKRRAYRSWDYWGKPVPGFGDPNARLLIIGLAPAAHGGNRTGRIFTGDRSGTFLMAALHRAGFANRPDSVHRDDGLRLRDAWLTAVVRCAPPDNQPSPAETARCLPYLERELELLTRVRAVLCLGRFALDGYRQVLRRKGMVLSQSALPFAHGAEQRLPPPAPRLFTAYHPSQQNTQTGRLTASMMDDVLGRIRRFLEQEGRLA